MRGGFRSRPLASEPTSHLKLNHKLADHEKEMIELPCAKKIEGRVYGRPEKQQNCGDQVDQH